MAATIKPIRSDVDHQAALDRIVELMGAEPGTPAADELQVLADLVEHYEAKHFPIEEPEPVEAIKFRMEQARLSARDLVPLIGTRAKVAEVLAGKRPITMSMARALHEHLGVPASVLLRTPAPPASNAGRLDWRRFPLKVMAERGWIPKAKTKGAAAEAALMGFFNRAGMVPQSQAALFRKSSRANSKADPYALVAWCAAVLSHARSQSLPATLRPTTVNFDFLHELAHFSARPSGPRRACDFLAAHGIHMIIEPHLPRTYLDGAALMLDDRTPVVALTLRYDRIDYFWFCLLHELAHVGRHMVGHDSEEAFLDDLSLRDAAHSQPDKKEREADEWAQEALVPTALLKDSEAYHSPTVANVVDLAQQLEVHPAIVAGRIRYEHRNYRLLSHLVGAGEIKKQFVEK